VIEFRLEPVLWGSLQIRENEGNFGFIIRKISGMDSKVYLALEEEHFQFVGIRTVKCIRDTRFDRSFRLCDGIPPILLARSCRACARSSV